MIMDVKSIQSGEIVSGKVGMDTFGFLVRLKKIDKRSLTVRDIILLFYIMHNPGCNGQEASVFCGVVNRSSIGLCLKRLLKAGMIEDRRLTKGKAVQNQLYATQTGIDFWNEIKP